MKTKKYHFRIAALCLAALGFAWSSHAQTTTFNNEKIRIGNGSENSINARGNMQQPFYKSGLNWFKLTYSTYALNASFGVGGDGTNEWNLNGTMLHDPVMSNHVINTSGFTYNAGSSGPGTGVVTSTGDLSVGGVALQVEHTYELLPDNSFIKVKVKITNQSASNADNVRMWVGTRDDWVGSTDQPTKQRGNLVDGAFQQIPNAGTKASVVRVTSAAEGVLFYTDTDKANSIIQSCCQWSNVYNQNPATAAVTNTGDGSYGFYVRLNDLAPGQSDEFTWFYAAGSIAELDDITDQVAQASGAISEITCSTATYDAQSSSDGTGYYVVVPAGATAPTADQIKAGVNYGSVGLIDSGSAAMTAGNAHAFGVENLVHSTDYTLYFVLEDAAPQFSNITTVHFSAGSAPSVGMAVQPATTCATAGNGGATATVTGGTAPYTFQWSSDETGASIADKAEGSYTLEVTDNGGCPTVTAVAEIGVDDQTPPIALTRDVTLFFDEDGQAILTPEMVNDGSTDDCEITEMELSQSLFTCDLPIDNNGYSVTLTVRDAAGNESSAEALVIAVDTIKPTAIAQNITLVLDVDGNATASPAMVDNGSTDNCSIAERSLSKTDFDCADLGTQVAILTVEDSNGNSRQVAFEITVEDHSAPSLEVQNTTLVLNAENMATLHTADIEVSADDNCSISSRTLSISEFDCSHLGENTVEMTVTDPAGNATTRTAVVTVIDATAPVAVGRDITLALDENGLASIAADQVEALFDQGSSDNCALDANGFAISTTEFDCSQLGEQVYMYTVTDIYGNTASTEVLIDVIDTIAPIAVATDLSIGLDMNGEASIEAIMADAGSTDNCSIASRSLSKKDFDCSDIGTQEVVLTVSDADGNTSQATFAVTVSDMMAPTATFAANAHVYLNAEGTASPGVEGLIAELHDNCGIANTLFNVAAFDCGDVGMQNISFIAEDFHGNLTQIDGQVMVVDTIKPVFALESIALELDSEGSAELTEAMLLPFATDACGIAEVAIQKKHWSCDDTVFDTQIVVFDMNGNVIQRTLGVELIDNESPVISAENLTLTLDASGRIDLHPDVFDYIATDNCAVVEVSLDKSRLTCQDLGEATVTITATDAAGNTASQTITVTVVDDIAPEIHMDEFIKVCVGELSYAGLVWATDNCGATLTQIAGPMPGTILTPGHYYVQFMAQDAAGNTAVKGAALEVLPYPEVDLGGNRVAAYGSMVELSAGTDPNLTYNWSTGESGMDISFILMEDVSISVTVSNSAACTARDEVMVTGMFPMSTSSNEDENSFNLYPNPATNEVNLTFGITGALSNSMMSITDLQGKLLSSKMLAHIENGQNVQVNVNDLAKGLYLITIVNENTRMTARFSKQ